MNRKHEHGREEEISKLPIPELTETQGTDEEVLNKEIILAEEEVADVQKNSQEKMTSLTREAKDAGFKIDTTDSRELDELLEEATEAKQALFSQIVTRAREILKIPKRLGSDYKRIEKSGALTQVDTFNSDAAIAPPIIRNPKSPLAKLLVSSALGLLGATHEPQIENVAHEGAKVAQVAYKLASKNISHAIDTASLSFGVGEARAQTLSKKGDFAGHGTKGEFVSTKNPKLDHFIKTLPALTEDGRQRVTEIFRQVEQGYIQDYADFFLMMEVAHGQLTEEDAQKVKDKIYELQDEIYNQLSKEPGALEDPVIVAHEISNIRNAYVSGKTGLGHIVQTRSGNCDALVKLEESLIHRLCANADTAVQVFDDHVQFLVRKQGTLQWTIIDGHNIKDLTVEEARGTLIVRSIDMAKNALGLVPPTKKQQMDTPAHMKGVKSDSVGIRWVLPSDSRNPHRSHGDTKPPDYLAEPPTPIEEARLAPRHHLKIVEVPLEYFDTTPEKPAENPSAEQVKLVRIAPDTDKIMNIFESGIVLGRYNDLKPLEGINITDLNLQDSSYNKIANFAYDVDLSPLKSADLKSIDINTRYKLLGFDELKLKGLETLRVGFNEHLLAEKAAEESEIIKDIHQPIDVESMGTAAAVELIKNGPALSKNPIFDSVRRIADSLHKKKIGKYTLIIISPVDNSQIEWSFSGENGKWTRQAGDIAQADYLSNDIRQTIDDNKNDHSTITIPSNINQLEYLQIENVDFKKIKKVILDNPTLSNEEEGSKLYIDLSVLQQATNLDTVIMQIPDFVYASTIDAEALNKLSFKKLILEIKSDSEDKIKITGLNPGIKIVTKYIQPDN